MLAGIIQSCFIPWRGHFDLIDDVEFFVFYDDVQYTTRDWRNRNKFKTPTGPEWFSVPVRYTSRSQLIDETRIDYSSRWMSKIRGLLPRIYSRAPAFGTHYPRFMEILEARHETISQLNQALTIWLMRELQIETPTCNARELEAVGTKTDRLLDVLRKIGATDYLSGPTAEGYIEVEKFREAGMGLQFKTYEYREYPQQHGEYSSAVSILDLLFNCGAQARDYLKSLKPNRVVCTPARKESHTR